MRGDAFDASTVASKVSYIGGGGSIVGWLVSSEGAALCGLFVAVAGFLVNWHFKAKQDRREQREHEMRMRRLGDKNG